MTQRLLAEGNWASLENDVREALRAHHIPINFWLVHDLMVAFRMALDAADLVRMEAVREHFRLLPVKLPGGTTMKPPDPGSSLVTGDRPPPG